MGSDRAAILLDGEYVKKTLGRRLGRFPTHADIMSEVDRILAHPDVGGLSLNRIFYYTADPVTGTARHPLDGSILDFGGTAAFARNRR
jgi:hypothetical protein